MKFIALADIHQSEEKWEQLVKTVRNHKPDFTLVAGDLLPKENGILGQLTYMPYLKDCAKEIKEAGSELVIIPGNDDNQLVTSELDEGDKKGRWHYLPDRARQIRTITFCGCPWIRDYPFAYKYWVAPESPDNLAISKFQLGPPLLINEENEIIEIDDLEVYLKRKLSIAESLEKLAGNINNPVRSIWLIHEPPAGLDLDLCATGERVGSEIVYDFLMRFQPLLSVHGHIHEAPKYNGGTWAGRIGRTLAIQAGQLDDALYYASFELREGRIKNLVHSVYGLYSN